MPHVARLAALFARYRAAHPGESAVVGHFETLLGDAGRAFERSRGEGHFTGSAWLVSADGERVLLTHHRKLGLWLQLGGHADGDPDLVAVALREAHEESGLAGLAVEGDVFDMDRHVIPARGDEPEHWHYDVRFVVRATGDEAFVVGEESLDLAWRRVAELVDDPEADASVRRMAGKWLARQARGDRG